MESYSSDSSLSNGQSPPKRRAVIEFVDGDLSRAPLVFPQAGSEEADTLLREEILRRWGSE